MLKFVVPVFALVCGFGAIGCGSDNTGSCERIVDACHEKDTGAGEAHDCHELGEGGATDDECADREEACLASCE